MPAGRVCRTPGCPTISDRTVCPEHAREQNRHVARTKPTAVTRDWTERRRRAAAVTEHRRRHGSWCPGWQRPAHAALDLTADHVVAVAAGGDPRGELIVRCRSCNSAKGMR